MFNFFEHPFAHYARLRNLKRRSNRKKLLLQEMLFLVACDIVCEFNVIIDGKTQFKDVIYAKVEGDKVTVKNILGELREFIGYRIVDVDVPNTRLVLATVKA